MYFVTNSLAMSARRPLYTPLHPFRCTERAQDFQKIGYLLLCDPVSYLERPQIPCMTECFLDSILPLHDACLSGHLHCVKLLVEAGADVNSLDLAMKNSVDYAFAAFEDINPFSKHVEERDPEIYFQITKYLLLHGAILNKTYDGVNYMPPKALKEALEHNENKSVQLLLEAGSESEEYVIINGKKVFAPKISLNFIEYSLCEGNVEGYKLLLLHGARNRVFCMKSDTDISRPFIEYSLPYHIINYAPKFDVNYALEALKTYQDFGGNLWQKDIWGGAYWEEPTEQHKNETALDYLRRKPNLMSDLPGLDIELEKMMKNPLSLKKLCRIVLRNCMGRNYWKTSQELHVQDNVKKFLLFDIKLY